MLVIGDVKQALVLIVILALSTTAWAVQKNGFVLDQALIPAAQIHAGGPPRDGIPALKSPRWVAANAVDYLRPDSRVIGIALQGQARAYPLAILNWHEVVNDQIGSMAVVVTYCPLCGTGVVYRAQAEEQTLSFGVSGLLYNSDVLLYDHQTESLWSQLMHRAISGPLKGARLQMVPSSLTTWADWRRRHPATQVLSDQTGYRRDYQRNPYGGYEESLALYFPVAFLSQQFHPKERVLGVELNGVARAYPLAELAKLGERGVVEERINGQPVEVHYDVVSGRVELFDETGQLLPAINSFWFAWFTFHPDTEVYRAPGAQ